MADLPNGTISPTPSDEEAAAIVAAMELMWPRPVVASADDVDQSTVWRFAGRHWNKPAGWPRRGY